MRGRILYNVLTWFHLPYVADVSETLLYILTYVVIDSSLPKGNQSAQSLYGCVCLFVLGRLGISCYYALLCLFNVHEKVSPVYSVIGLCISHSSGV